MLLAYFVVAIQSAAAADKRKEVVKNGTQTEPSLHARLYRVIQPKGNKNKKMVYKVKYAFVSGVGKDALPAEMSLHERYYREIQPWDKKMLYKVKFAFASGIGKDALPVKKRGRQRGVPLRAAWR